MKEISKIFSLPYQITFIMEEEAKDLRAYFGLNT